MYDTFSIDHIICPHCTHHHSPSAYPELSQGFHKDYCLECDEEMFIEILVKYYITSYETYFPI